MAPPLEGGEITEGALDQLLSRLIEICSCLRPPSMLGVDMPMTWEPAIESTIASLVTPDPPQLGAPGERSLAARPRAGCWSSASAGGQLEQPSEVNNSTTANGGAEVSAPGSKAVQPKIVSRPAMQSDG